MVIYNRIAILSFLMLTLSSCSVDYDTDTQDNTESIDSASFEQKIIEKEMSMYVRFLENPNVEEISLPELKKLSDNITENKLIYFGRSTCTYCRKLMIENGERLEASNMEMLYVDTDRIPRDSKITLEDYGIEEVPSFIQLADNGRFTKVETSEFERMIEHD